MKKVCVVGHFGFGENMLNGQTIKTKTVTTELEKQLGADQVIKIDTHGGAKALPKITSQLIIAFKNCKNIIIFPAHNGIKVFVPLCNAINKVFHRKLHYVVIGGWLPTLLQKHKRLAETLKSFNGIYVETKTMKKALVEQGFSNIFVMPNFKKLNILEESQLIYQHSEPYKLCTFSRVMKEKGIEDAVSAVKTVNTHFGRTVYTLDIYGQVDSEQTEWFANLEGKFSPLIHYKGVVPPEKSVDVLKKYYALLLPTRFYTEGIPGTIIDAYSAGVPVVCSKWESFYDIVEDGVTGFGYEFGNQNEFVSVLEYMVSHVSEVNELKYHCIQKARDFSASEALSPLIRML